MISKAIIAVFVPLNRKYQITFLIYAVIYPYTRDGNIAGCNRYFPASVFIEPHNVCNQSLCINPNLLLCKAGRIIPLYRPKTIAVIGARRKQYILPFRYIVENKLNRYDLIENLLLK